MNIHQKQQNLFKPNVKDHTHPHIKIDRNSSPNKNCFRNYCGSELILVVASEPDFRSEL